MHFIEVEILACHLGSHPGGRRFESAQLHSPTPPANGRLRSPGGNLNHRLLSPALICGGLAPIPVALQWRPSYVRRLWQDISKCPRGRAAERAGMRLSEIAPKPRYCWRSPGFTHRRRTEAGGEEAELGEEVTEEGGEERVAKGAWRSPPRPTKNWRRSPRSDARQTTPSLPSRVVLHPGPNFAREPPGSPGIGGRGGPTSSPPPPPRRRAWSIRCARRRRRRRRAGSSPAASTGGRR
jgi:hypothetical protein